MADEMKSLKKMRYGNWLNLHLVEKLSGLSEFTRSNEMVMVESNVTRHDWWRKAILKQKVPITMRHSLL